MEFLNKKTLVILIEVILLIGFTGWFVYKYEQEKRQFDISSRPAQELQKQDQDLPKREEEQISTPAVNIKTYRNEEWGFEFQYPEDWITKENTFGSYYSKFNMVVRPTVSWYSRFPVSVNIVLPEFPERSFRGVEKITSEVTLNGVLGVKYQYEFEGSQETAIILPFGEYKIILDTDDERYTDVYNQIISTFKFVK
ncbi:hypothetical protein GW888_01315 [Candidatus Wolfebacteria bacterium]|uniref:PsbP C-terminal domain-containing protein n=2 Tax=Parcubacteria group TaxID=1794811 RepID=A0A2M7Z2W2_9BACT|nr:hypothetical protein [Candidatus Wolfebacteria bacterium]OIO65940.1 MAG: hypothetical protein AUJ30_00045 [Candidatus Wolfebacteria bacterium CG1_02_39_135]PJA82833.1 MAG: hypothetical protein CO146_02370 [Candidatus Nealsonbacteria bacterium CG_4_9_14_3_um_filter_37_29]